MTVLDDIPVLNFYRHRNRLSIALAKGFLVSLPVAIILSVILGISCGTLHACPDVGEGAGDSLKKKRWPPSRR